MWKLIHIRLIFHTCYYGKQKNVIMIERWGKWKVKGKMGANDNR